MATDDEFLQVTLPALDLVHNLARRFAPGSGGRRGPGPGHLSAGLAGVDGRKPAAPGCAVAGHDLPEPRAGPAAAGVAAVGGRRRVAEEPAADVDVEARRWGHPSPGAAIWVTEVDGVAVLCADRPSPSLLVGRGRAEVLLTASRLGLH
jgi:hypothetical protein